MFVFLQLQEEIVRAKDIVIPVQAARWFPDRLLTILHGTRPRHAAGGADQTFGVGCQELVVDAWEIIKAFELGGAGNFQQLWYPVSFSASSSR